MCFLTDPQYSSGNSLISQAGNALAKIDQTIGVSAISKGLADLDSSLGISTTVTALAKDPLPTLATIGLTMLAVPAPIASAMVTAARGGSMEDIIKGAAIAYIGGEAGKTAGKAFAGTDFAMKTLSPELASTLTKVVTSASGDAAVAALQGRPLNDVLAASMNSLVTSYVTQGLTKELGLTDPKLLSTKISSGAISAATQAILNGKDIGKAITTSVTQTALSEGIKTGVDTIVANSTTLQGLQKDFSTAKKDAEDYFTKTLNPQYTKLSEAFTTANTSRAAVQTAALEYQTKYDKYLEDKEAADKYVQPMGAGYYTYREHPRSGATIETWNPGTPVAGTKTKEEVLAEVNKQVPAIEAAVTKFNAAATKASTDTAKFNTAQETYSPLKSLYESLVGTATTISEKITGKDAEQKTLIEKLSADSTAYGAETEKNADVVAVEEAKAVVLEANKTLITDAIKQNLGRDPTEGEVDSWLELDSVRTNGVFTALESISTGQEAKNYAGIANGVDSATLEAEKADANQAITDWFSRSNIVKGSWANKPSLKPGEDMTTLMASAPKAVMDAFNRDLIKGSADFGTAYAMARTAYGGNKTFEWTNPDTGKTSSFSTNTKEEVALKPYDASSLSMSRSGLGGAAQSALNAGKTSFIWNDGKTYKVPDAYAFLKGGDQSSAENKRLLEAGVAPVKSNGQTALDNAIGVMGESAGGMLAKFGQAVALATGDSNYKNAMISAGNMLGQWGQNKSSGDALATETANVKAAVEAAGKSSDVFTSAQILGKAVFENPIGMFGIVAGEVTEEGIQKLLGGAAGVVVGGLVSLVATPAVGVAAGYSTYRAVQALSEGVTVWGSTGMEIEKELNKQGVPSEKARNIALLGATSAALVAIPSDYIADQAVSRAWLDGVNGAIKEMSVKYGKSMATQVASGMVEGTSQSAITQYSTTGRVNMVAAVTSGYFEAIAGSAAAAGMMSPAAIKDLTVIGKDFSGSNVTFRDFISGDKAVDPDTFNTTISLGKSASGSNLTLGSFTAMGVQMGFDTDTLSSILPSSLTSVNSIIGTDAQGVAVTFGQLDALTQGGTNADSANIIGNFYAGNNYVTSAESKAALEASGVANPTADQIATYTGQKDQATTLPAPIVRGASDIVLAGPQRGVTTNAAFDGVGPTNTGNTVITGGDTGAIIGTGGTAVTGGSTDSTTTTGGTAATGATAGLTTDQVTTIVNNALAANPSLTEAQVTTLVNEALVANPGITAEQVATAVADATKNFATKTDIQNALKEIIFPTGMTSDDITSAITAYMKENPSLTLAEVANAIATGTSGFATDEGVRTSISNALKGVATNADIKKAIDGIVFPAGLSKEDVAAQMKAAMDANPGLTVADVTASITAYMTENPALTAADMNTAIENAVSGLATKTALETAKTDLTKAISDLSTKTTTDTTALTEAIADLKAAGLTADQVKALIDTSAVNTSAETKAAIEEATSGLATTNALDTAKTALTKAITDLSDKTTTDTSALATAIADLKAAGLTAEQVNTLVTTSAANTSAETQTAIANAVSGLATAADVQTKYEALTAEQKTIADNLKAQGIEINAAIAQAALTTAADIAGVKTDAQTKYEALTTAQKSEVDARVLQGETLAAAIVAAQTKTETQIGNLTADLQTKYDSLTKSDQAIVNAQIQQGIDTKTAIDNATTKTTEQIQTVKTDLTKNITDVQTQFNVRVDELVSQGQTYQQATQAALGELNTGVLGLQSSVADIRSTQVAEAAAAAAALAAAAKAGRANTAKQGRQALLNAGAAQFDQAGTSAVEPERPMLQTGLISTGGNTKFESVLGSFLKDAEAGFYDPKQLNEPQQQAAPAKKELDMQNPQGTNYFNYGSEYDIGEVLAENPGTEMLFSKAGGLATPLFAGGGKSRKQNYAGGALNVISHEGKPRIDFRTGNAVTGPGDGQSDDIPAMLADGEFVFPADVVAALGNGSTKAGSDKLYDMMHSIRAYHRSAKPKDLPPPAKKSPLDYLKKTA